MRILSEEEEAMFAARMVEDTKDRKEMAEEMLHDLKRITHEVDGICIGLAVYPGMPMTEGMRLRERVLGSLEELEKAVEEYAESCRRTASELGGRLR